MTRHGFTLVEVLAATVLTTGIAITSATWLLHLQRASTAVHQQSHDLRAVLLVGTLLRRDLVHAAPEAPIDVQRREMLVGSPSRLVAWSLADGVVTRAERDPSGGVWTRAAIATGITSLALTRDAQNRIRIQVAAGTDRIDLPAATMVADAP